MASPDLSKKNPFEIIGKIGSGSFGTVFKIRMKETNEIYALKTINFSRFYKKVDKENELECAKQEYKILKGNYRNVAKGIGSFYDECHDEFSYSMELYKQNLKDFIFENYNKLTNPERKPMTLEKLVPLIKDILAGINNLSPIDSSLFVYCVSCLKKI